MHSDSLGELHPNWHRTYGPAERGMAHPRHSLEAIDLPEPVDPAKKWALLHQVMAKADERDAGEITQAQFLDWLAWFHDTTGATANLCFHCGSLYHEWELDASGMPTCGNPVVVYDEPEEAA